MISLFLVSVKYIFQKFCKRLTFAEIYHLVPIWLKLFRVVVLLKAIVHIIYINLNANYRGCTAFYFRNFGCLFAKIYQNCNIFTIQDKKKTIIEKYEVQF